MFDKRNIKKIIVIDEQVRIPKYRQIIQRVIDAINVGQLTKGDLLPSINEVCRDCSLSRDTVVKAYDHLKKVGILTPVHGKGFYIQCNRYQGEKRVFVLFDELATPYKNVLYSALKAGVADHAHLDIYFHHYNPVEFERLVTLVNGHYEYYVVMTFDSDSVRNTLAGMDQDKLLVLDQFNEYPGRNCAVIRQNYVEQQVLALDEVADDVKHYESFTLVFPREKNHPRCLKNGFRQFCNKHSITGHVVSDLKPADMKKNRAYLVIEDDDLVLLVKYRRDAGLVPGKDIGIVSYNEIPFKEVVDDGITVISIDFEDMGRRAAQQILNPVPLYLVCPTKLIRRGSI